MISDARSQALVQVGSKASNNVFFPRSRRCSCGTSTSLLTGDLLILELPFFSRRDSQLVGRRDAHGVHLDKLALVSLQGCICWWGLTSWQMQRHHYISRGSRRQSDRKRDGAAIDGQT